jgi:hypothetical protein
VGVASVVRWLKDPGPKRMRNKRATKIDMAALTQDVPDRSDADPYERQFSESDNAYNMAFTDRLQGNGKPDMFFSPSETTYVESAVPPGAYSADISAG